MKAERILLWCSRFSAPHIRPRSLALSPHETLWCPKSATFLTAKVGAAVARGAVPTAQAGFVGNFASGWAAQVGFMNAMLASFFSTISVWSASRSYEGVGATVALLLIIFTPMLFFVLSYDPDQVVAVKVGPFKTTPSTICKGVLLVVNLILVVGIAWSQQLPPPGRP